MADTEEDLDIDGDARTGSSSQQVRKNINLKLKSSPKGKGRGRKAPVTRGRKRVVEEEPPEPLIDSDDEVIVPSMKPLPGEPVHQDARLNWNHKVQLIGEKVLDPAIHCCEKCNMPILIYGRMIPCKHVFCFDCAKKTEKNCARCSDPVIRIEQSALGTVFVCRYGSRKHAVNGCRRTYLSQRDLQAHIDHRHLKKSSSSHSRSSSSHSQHSSQQSSSHHHSARGLPAQPMVGHQATAQQPQTVAHDQMMYQHQRQPDGSQMHHVPPQQGQPPAHHQALPQQTMPPQQGMAPPQGHPMPQQDPYHANIEQQPIHRAPSNLISVPIQDEASRHQQPPPGQGAYQGQSYSHQSGSYPPSQPPPQQHYTSSSHPQPHSTGPYTSAPYNPPPHSAPPQMRTSMSQPHHTTAQHHGAPPSRSVPGGPPRYPSPHNRSYDDQYGGNHSPRTWAAGGAPPPGPGSQSRGQPQTRAPSSTSNMGPPPSRQQQYY